MEDLATEQQFGSLFHRIVREQSEWSQATFGIDEERGPMGALLHLEQEAREAQECPDDVTEYADCLLLIIDASRRAGINPMALLQHTYDKLQVCKQRKWPVPDGDQPVQHIADSGNN